jgi:hypothetical protein
MRDRPDGTKLLEIARAALLENLLPVLPEDQRFTARLVANAMAIAARELAVGDAPMRTERAALDHLVGDSRDGVRTEPDTESLDEALQRLTWRFAAEIRAGGRDGDRETYDVLRDGTIERVRLTNPRRLGG